MKRATVLILAMLSVVPAFAALRPQWNKTAATGTFQVYAGTMVFTAPGSLNVWATSATYTSNLTINGVSGDLTANTINVASATIAHLSVANSSMTLASLTAASITATSSATITNLETGGRHWEMIYSTTTGVATSSFTAAGIGGYNKYRVVCRVKCDNNSGYITASPNGIYTNYNTQAHWSKNTTLTAENYAPVGFPVAICYGTYMAMFETLIYAKTGQYRFSISNGYSEEASYAYTATMGARQTDTSTAFTSFTIRTAANSIQPGSEFEIWAQK